MKVKVTAADNNDVKAYMVEYTSTERCWFYVEADSPAEAELRAMEAYEEDDEFRDKVGELLYEGSYDYEFKGLDRSAMLPAENLPLRK